VGARAWASTATPKTAAGTCSKSCWASCLTIPTGRSPRFCCPATPPSGHVFCTFLALILRKELIDRLTARRRRLEWQRIIDDLADLSEIEVEQDGPGPAAHRPRPNYRPDLPRPRPHPAARLPRNAARPLNQPPKLWCLNLKMAYKPLIIRAVQNETAEVGFKSGMAPIDGGAERLAECFCVSTPALLRLTQGLTYCGGISRTSWLGQLTSRVIHALEHAPFPIKQPANLRKNSSDWLSQSSAQHHLVGNVDALNH
jgi:hypothetical protein